MPVVIECSGESIECNAFGKGWCRYDRYGVDANSCFHGADFHCECALSCTKLTWC